ncbi:MAG: S24/S26 family peptidase [Muribaculaceae bacterium]|nr:S24/S26 family peptidase [Muribaculaceae bacterium]
MNDTRSIDNEILLGEICLHLSQGKRVKFRAKGNSMRPFIQGNEDILLLSPSDSLHKDDIVLACIDGKRYVIHRIIGIRGDKITLMGDGNLYGTEKCSRSDIFGTVVRIVHKGKEYNMTSLYASLSAKIWRFVLPIRRMKTKISNKIIRK